MSKGDYFFWESLWEFSGFVFPQMWQIIGNKVKGQISKRVFQENKARQIFRKRTFLTPWYAHVRTCAYEDVRNVRFSKNLARFLFLKHPFWDSRFCLTTGEVKIVKILKGWTNSTMPFTTELSVFKAFKEVNKKNRMYSI